MNGFTLKVAAGVAAAATFGASGALVVAQSIFDESADALDRLVGGGVLLGVGYFIVRSTFKLLAIARDNAQEDRAAALERERLLVTENARLSTEVADLKAKYMREREARKSLETIGLRDRRRHDYPNGEENTE